MPLTVAMHWAWVTKPQFVPPPPLRSKYCAHHGYAISAREGTGSAKDSARNMASDVASDNAANLAVLGAAMLGAAMARAQAIVVGMVSLSYNDLRKIWRRPSAF
jgi:hypothetical protein